jgi:uncharacterized lipoprotein YmbA
MAQYGLGAGIAAGVNRGFDRLEDNRARNRRLDELERRGGLMEQQGQREEQRLQSQLGLQSLQQDVLKLKRSKMEADAQTEGVAGATRRILAGDLKGAERFYNSMGKDKIFNLREDEGGGGIYRAEDAEGNEVLINPLQWAEIVGLPIKTDPKTGKVSVLTSAEIEETKAQKEHGRKLEIEGIKGSAKIAAAEVTAKGKLKGKGWTKEKADKQVVSFFTKNWGENFNPSEEQQQEVALKAALFSKLIRTLPDDSEIDVNHYIAETNKRYKEMVDGAKEEAAAEVEAEAKAGSPDQDISIMGLKVAEGQFGQPRTKEIETRAMAKVQALIDQIAVEDASAENVLAQEAQATAAPATAYGANEGGVGATGNAAGSGVRVKTLEEAMNLPPGTRFIDPNGVSRIR